MVRRDLLTLIFPSLKNREAIKHFGCKIIYKHKRLNSMPPDQPELISSYVEFVGFRNRAQADGIIDLKNRKWLSSSSVLLLAYLKREYSPTVISDRSNTKGYFDQMTQDPTWWIKETKLILSKWDSYIPFSQLPKEETDFKVLFAKLSDLIKSHKPNGGEQAFKYVLGELTDNIYQHSNFENSYVMCQAYKTKGYVELSFIDDGISIPGNFEKHKIGFEGDWNAISLAVSGWSTKDDYERGTGLRSSLRIYCEGAEAEAMIVSRNGIYYKKSQKTQLYRLDDQQKFPGTLISIRIPMRVDNIEIYQYTG